MHSRRGPACVLLQSMSKQHIEDHYVTAEYLLGDVDSFHEAYEWVHMETLNDYIDNERISDTHGKLSAACLVCRELMNNGGSAYDM